MLEPIAAERRPTGPAFVAALAPLLGAPVALVFFALAIHRDFEVGLVGSLADAWNEGGWGMYLVFLTGGVVAVVSAVLIFFGVQRGSVGILGSAPLSALIVGSGAFGYVTAMRGAADAVMHANPADRATIMAGATSEALNCSAFAFACAAGLVASIALGCLFGALMQAGLARKLLVCAGAMFVLLAAVDGVSMLRLTGVMAVFSAVAHVAPADRLTILEGATVELEQYRVWLLGALATLAAVLAVGAAMLKTSPRAALLLPILGLGGLASVGIQAGARSLANQQLERFATTSHRSGFVSLDGLPTTGASWCLKGDAVIEWIDGAEGDVVPSAELAQKVGEPVARLRSLREAAEEPHKPVAVSIGVMPQASAAGLWQVIDAAAQAEAGVELVGETEPPPAKVAGELAALVQLMRSTERSVPVDLAHETERCPNGCQLAVADGDKLKVDQESWTAAPLTGTSGDLKGEVLIKADRTLRPEQLMRLAAASAAHGRRLVMLLPDAPAPAAQDDEQGGLSKDELLRVVKAHQPEIKLCYEQQLRRDPSLAGAVTMHWTINALGQVEDVSATKDTLGVVSGCIVDRVRRWRFPRPRNGEPVEVNFPWIFKPAH